MLEVKIQIKGSAKEYTLEVEDKSKFINDIKSVIENKTFLKSFLACLNIFSCLMHV